MILVVGLVAAGSARPTAARAEAVDITAGQHGRFERRTTVAPGTVAEVCGRLARADEVAWCLEAGGPLDIGVHDLEVRTGGLRRAVVRVPTAVQGRPGSRGGTARGAAPS